MRFLGAQTYRGSRVLYRISYCCRHWACILSMCALFKFGRSRPSWRLYSSVEYYLFPFADELCYPDVRSVAPTLDAFSIPRLSNKMMDDDDDNFFSRLDRDNNPFQDRLRNAARDDDDAPMPAAPPLFEDEDEETPLQKLIRHWMNERHAPDVLPVAEDVLAGLLDHIRRQVGEILLSTPSSSRMRS